MNRRLVAAAMGLTLLISGCGLKLPQSVGVLERAVDVNYGRQHPVPPAPRPHAEEINAPAIGPGIAYFVPPPVGPLLPGQPRPVLPSQPPFTPCPAAAPLSFPALESTNEPRGVPLPIPYPYRVTRTVKAGRAPAKTTEQTDFRQVSAIAYVPQGSATPVTRYYYQVTERDPDAVVTKTTWWPRPEDSPATGIAGMYLISIEKDLPDGTMTIFAPSGGNGVAGAQTGPGTGIRFMSFPAIPETAPSKPETGVDPVTAVNMTITHQTLERPSPTNGQLRIDACGHIVDSWDVHVIGFVRTPNANPLFPTTFLSIEGVFAFATQFGGQIVGLDLTYKALDPQDQTGRTPATGDAAFSSHQFEEINAVPQPPCAVPASWGADGTFKCVPAR